MKNVLRRIKHTSINVIVNIICIALKRLLPRAIIAQVMDRIEVEGRLDFADKNIILGVKSLSELSRLRSCSKEPGTVSFFTELIGSNAVYYDIGANVGAYSLIAGMQNPNTRVFCFEPSASTFASLVSNIRRNGVTENVFAFPIAFDEATKVTQLYQSSTSPGAAEHAIGEAIDYKGKEFVPNAVQASLVYTLDEFIDCFELPVPTHLKIDVDGIELRILRGAINLLQNKRLRKVMLEVKDGSQSEQSIVKLMSEFGFTFYVSDRLYYSGCSNYVFQR